MGAEFITQSYNHNIIIYIIYIIISATSILLYTYCVKNKNTLIWLGIYKLINSNLYIRQMMCLYIRTYDLIIVINIIIYIII